VQVVVYVETGRVVTMEWTAETPPEWVLVAG
jgi:hypothetical protein